MEEMYEMPIPLSLENIIDDDEKGMIEYDKHSFKNGVDDVSYVCGMFSALRTAGISEENALDMIYFRLSEEEKEEDDEF